MKAIIIQILVLAAAISTANAQNDMDRILAGIDQNNPTLATLRKQVEARKLANKTGIYLQNPEAGVNFFWGTPGAIGNRTDVSFTQSFDFPTAYAYRNRIAESRNEQADLVYMAARSRLFLEVRILCNDLTYNNTRETELDQRMVHAEGLLRSYQAKFDQGDATILELNKARLNVSVLRQQADANRIEKGVLLGELASLNGGKPVIWQASTYYAQVIPADFDRWYQTVEEANSSLREMKKETEISAGNQKLQKSLALPGFSAGYLSEKTVGQNFQGVTLGMTIPLWENKNQVRYAKAQTAASESREKDGRLLYYNRLRQLHQKAVGLEQSVARFRSELTQYDNAGYLQKALDGGEITLIDYFLELSLIYSGKDALQLAERELNRVIAELYGRLE